MAVATTLRCPHCGKSTRTAKVLVPNTRVHCPHCGEVFQILPHEGSLVETIPVLGVSENERSRERLARDNRSTPGVTSGDAARLGDASPLPVPRAPAPEVLP